MKLQYVPGTFAPQAFVFGNFCWLELLSYCNVIFSWYKLSGRQKILRNIQRRSEGALARGGKLAKIVKKIT